MSKLKTHKSASRRIKKKTRAGLYMALSMSAQHRTSGKSARVKQTSGKARSLSDANNKRLAKLLPYL
ncbi:MAG: hypothetical protein AAB701_01900 [Patescibacteria group bacterium]